MMMTASVSRNAALFLAVVVTAEGATAIVSTSRCESWGKDVGGGDNECGYMKELLVIGAPGYDFSKHSWIASKNIPTKEYPMLTDVEVWAQCQMHCAEMAACSFFAVDTADGICVLKEAYESGKTCEPLYQAKADSVSGPNVCPDCFMESFDYKSQNPDCGYAKEVKVFGAPGYDFSAHSWIADKGIASEHVDSADKLEYSVDCQFLCMMMLKDGCAHFSFNKDTKLCVLKEAYAGEGCAPFWTGVTAAYTSGPAVCHNCLVDGNDVAAGKNSCGYAPELIMYGGPGYDFTKHSWLESKGIPSKHVDKETDLDSAMDCRGLCNLTPNCAYFVYDSANQGIGHCMLKAAYQSPLCQGLYGPKSESKISGLMECASVGGKMTTCAAVKAHYKGHKCCGSPGKEVPLM